MGLLKFQASSFEIFIPPPPPLVILNELSLNNGLVVLKFPLDFLCKFLQEYEEWLLGFRSLKL